MTASELSVPVAGFDPRTDFAAVYESHYQAVYRAVRAVVLDPALAEDVTQDAFVKAFRARDRYRQEGRLEEWLCTIGVREALSRLRWVELQRRVLRVAGRLHLGPAAPAGLDDLVEEALLQLPAKSRAVVVLHHHHGYRYREIAGILGIPEGTVASRLSAALRQLREHIERARGSAAPEETE